MKASDITDEQVYEIVAASSRNIAVDRFVQAFPEFPAKVVRAKLRQMIAKGRLRGCPCGCRGDIRFPWEQFATTYDRAGWKRLIDDHLNRRMIQSA